MGKLVVFANHASNECFKQFLNCRTDKKKYFMDVNKKALAEEPAQMIDALRYKLSWEAAREQFLKETELDLAAFVPIGKSFFQDVHVHHLRRNVEDASARLHYVASG